MEMITQTTVATDEPQHSLASRARSGSRDAFDALYHATVSDLKAFIAYRSHRWDMIEECLQNTYITAYRQLDRFDPERPFAAWLKGIARNEIGKYLRRLHISSKGGERALLDTQLARVGSSDDEDEDLSSRLAHCLQRLGEGTRSLIWQRYVEERPVQSMAERAQRTANAISVSLHRARSALRKCIAGEAP